MTKLTNSILASNQFWVKENSVVCWMVLLNSLPPMSFGPKNKGIYWFPCLQWVSSQMIMEYTALQIFTVGILPNYDLMTVIWFELPPLIVHCHWSYCKNEITTRLRPIDCKKLNYHHWQYTPYDCTVKMKLQSFYSIKMPNITMDWL